MNQITQRHFEADNSAPTAKDSEKLWSLAELSRRYGVHVGTVRRWSREGRLATVQIGRFKRVRDRDRDRFESRQSTERL